MNFPGLFLNVFGNVSIIQTILMIICAYINQQTFYLQIAEKLFNEKYHVSFFNVITGFFLSNFITEK